MNFRLAIASLLCLGVCPAFGQLTQAEHEGIKESLYIGNLKVSDLVAPRSPFPKLPQLPLVARSITDPLGTADELMLLHSSAQNSSLIQLATISVEQVLGAVLSPPSPTSGTNPQGIQSLPPELAAIVSLLAQRISRADSEIRESLAGLTPEQQRTLIESLPVLAVEEPKVKFSFVKGQPATLSEAQVLLAKVDLKRLLLAGLQVVAAAEVAESELQKVSADIPQKLKIRVMGLIVVIGGRGSDSHDDVDARITIDLGGNDTYTGRHAAGVGYSSVLIDLSGDDRYDVPDLSLGAGVLGAGVAIDSGGNDRFTTDSISLGAGIAGIGVFLKKGGSDIYMSQTLAQGFGFHGVGLMVDTAGFDTYRVGLFGQGAARTSGVGWLVDRTGRDIYQAGGISLNSPLFSNVYYSFSQGFGMGFREDTGGVAGGIGLLTDLAGDDHYLADTYAQAASYWYSVGSLYDASGNDSYNGHHYVQACAMHATGAYLFDLAGDDAYTVKVGAAQAIGHDYGVAFLLDRDGNDLYASRDARVGSGIANGTAIFVETAGDDTYTNVPATGQLARSMASIGIFADLSGNDKYPDGLQSGWASLSGNWAMVWDAAHSVSASIPDQPTPPEVKPGSVPYPNDLEMDRLYRLATQWGVGTAQEEVEKAVSDLIAIGVPALEWMLDKRLATANRLHIRAYVRLVEAIGNPAIAVLGRKALNATDEEWPALLRIAVDGSIQDFGALLPTLMKDKPHMKLAAIRAAGSLKARGSVPQILVGLLEADDLTKRASMVSLAQIGDPTSFGTASAMINSNDAIIRDAAMQILLTEPEQAVILARQFVTGTDEVKARIGLQMLGKINMYNSEADVIEALVDPRPGLRITAMQVLAGKCPEEAKERFLSLRSDPVPIVRAVAMRLNP